MPTISMQKEVPVVGNFDIVVCGGGPAGIMASVAAARSGAKVALIERYGFVGGMATAGLVTPISVFMYNGRLVVGGIPWEFINRLEAEKGAQVELPLGNVSFVPEVYKLVAQRMLLEAGVTLYLHAYISGCEMADGRVTHVVFESKSGTQAVTARYFKEAAYIPYRALIVEGFPNLLVAGRSFSADREASASARVQGSVMGIGQAAGLAAALCRNRGGSVSEIDVDELRRQLMQLGANI